MPAAAQYFAWWNGDPVYIGGQAFQAPQRLIHPYFSSFGQWSLALTIPQDWQALYLPGQVRHEGRDGTHTLPTALSNMITTLGFQAIRNNGHMGVVGNRIYGLRQHDFPITVGFYQTHILPRIRSVEIGPMRGPNGKSITIPNQQRFERTLPDALEHHLHHIEQLSQAPTHDLAAWVDFIQAHGSDEGWANL